VDVCCGRLADLSSACERLCVDCGSLPFPDCKTRGVVASDSFVFCGSTNTSDVCGAETLRVKSTDKCGIILSASLSLLLLESSISDIVFLRLDRTDEATRLEGDSGRLVSEGVNDKVRVASVGGVDGTGGSVIDIGELCS